MKKAVFLAGIFVLACVLSEIKAQEPTGPNLVRDGDFSDHFVRWTLTGIIENTDIVEEGGIVYAILGPGTMMYQDIDLMPQEYTVYFNMRAPWQGGGVKIKLQCIEENGQLGQTVFEQPFGESVQWEPKSILATISCNKVRLSFEVDSHAYIRSVMLVPTP